VLRKSCPRESGVPVVAEFGQESCLGIAPVGPADEVVGVALESCAEPSTLGASTGPASRQLRSSPKRMRF
jgi:hypothetical protein